MKRNPDLIRALLLEIEDCCNDPTEAVAVTRKGYTPRQVQYHLRLLREAGLIDAVNGSSGSTMDYRPKSLTWRGHEFLDAVRADEPEGAGAPVEMPRSLTAAESVESKTIETAEQAAFWKRIQRLFAGKW